MAREKKFFTGGEWRAVEWATDAMGDSAEEADSEYKREDVPTTMEEALATTNRYVQADILDRIEVLYQDIADDQVFDRAKALRDARQGIRAAEKLREHWGFEGQTGPGFKYNPEREPTPDQRRKFAQEAVLWMEEQWVEWTAKIDGGLFDPYRIVPENRVMWSDITAQFPGLSSVLGREDYHEALMARQAELPWLDAVNRGHRKLKTGNVYGFKYRTWEAEVAAAERAARKKNPSTNPALVRELKF